MRLSELLGLDVLDVDNSYVGTVADLRLVQDGPLIGPYGAALRLSGLIVVEHRHVRLLGFERDVGPWFLRWLVRRITGRVCFIPWNDVRAIDPTGVHTTGHRDRCQQLSELPDRRQPSAH
jgi:sporulation protein YlmC with PRC-barrel domain